MAEYERKAKKKPNQEGWMATFTDMTTLILTFFVSLVSMAQFQKIKLLQLRQGLEDISAGYRIPPKGQHEQSRNPKLFAIWKELTEKPYDRTGDFAGPPTDEPWVQQVRVGLLITVGGLGFFEPGSYELTPAARDRIDQIQSKIADLPNKIQIRGHTSSRDEDAVVVDPDPAGGGRASIVPFDPKNPAHEGRADHRLLSMLRAREVAGYLIRGAGRPPGLEHQTFRTDPRRVQVIGSSYYEALEDDGVPPPEATPEKKLAWRRNLRVEIVVSEELPEGDAPAGR